MTEQWKAIPGMPLYMASSLGRIKRLAFTSTNNRRNPEVICKQHIGSKGYLTVNTIHGTKTVHPLVARAFIGERPEGLDTCHNDGNPSNNHIDNLRYDTRRNNLLDQFEHGTYNNGMKAKTHCKRGHDLNGDDVTVNSKGYRVCLACKRENNAKFYETHGSEYYSKYRD